MTTIIEQIDINIAAINSSNECLDAQPKLENKKLNAITEAEIAMVRLGGLSTILHSLKEPAPIIDKVINSGILNSLSKSLVTRCSADRLNSVAQALTSFAEPLHKLVGQQAASLSQVSGGPLLELVLSITTLLKKVGSKKKP